MTDRKPTREPVEHPRRLADDLVVVAALIVSAVLCGGGASDCEERPEASICTPQLVEGSDPLPPEYFHLARNIIKRRDENYLCRAVEGDRLEYHELPLAEVRRRCGNDRVSGCYAPGPGRPAHVVLVSVERGRARWIKMHEFGHYLACTTSGLCTRDESHTWMQRAGLPGGGSYR